MQTSTGGQHLAQASKGVLETIVKEFQDAFMHDGLLWQFLLEELGNEPYEAESCREGAAPRFKIKCLLLVH